MDLLIKAMIISFLIIYFRWDDIIAPDGTVQKPIKDLI